MHAQRGGKMCQWGFSINPFKVFELTYSKNKSIEIESVIIRIRLAIKGLHESLVVTELFCVLTVVVVT